jgi:hypothetical protein
MERPTVTTVIEQIESNHILFETYTWLADVSASVAKCLCFLFRQCSNNQQVI